MPQLEVAYNMCCPGLGMGYKARSFGKSCGRGCIFTLDAPPTAALEVIEKILVEIDRSISNQVTFTTAKLWRLN